MLVVAKHAKSVHGDDAVHGAEFAWLNKPLMRHADRMERPLDLTPPELQKLLQRRKSRREVIVLPDIELEQRRLVRHAVVDLCGGKSIAIKLLDETAVDHRFASPSSMPLG